MKKRILVSALLAVFVLFAFSGLALSHSGRTDAQGGHRDNKNVSGLGYYHYHHGYGPHLHPGGVCPYDTPSTTTQNTTTSKPKPIDYSYRVWVNGQRLSCPQAPYAKNGSIMVPMRAIFEALGATVDWNDANQKVTATKGNRIIAFRLGSQVAIINGNNQKMTPTSTRKNNHTMVPVRFISEAMGAIVEYQSRDIYITQTP